MAGAASARPIEPIDSRQEILVRDELERVCEDKLFRDTTRMKRFLRFVVEETLAGRGNRLKGYVIGVEVFDRPDNFDPQADTIVRVQAGQLRRRLDLYYAGDGAASPVRILIPKGRYAPTFELRQSLEVNETIDPTSMLGDVSDKTKDPRPSLAVMSLDDLSSSETKSGDYFVDGLTAEIVNALVQFRSIRVVTLTPSVSTTLAQKSVREIGKDIGADFVLSGSVRRDGDVFRVTVSLIRCESSEHLLSRVFDREYKPGSLFNLQEEIASYTAAAIAAPYGAVNRYNRRNKSGRQKSMAAYDCVLRYYDMKLSPKRQVAEKLLDDVESVTKHHPEFSMGWAIHALLNNFLATQIHFVEEASVRLLEADRSARRALKVDSQNSLGYFALYQSFFHRGKFEDANQMICRTMSLNSNDYSVLAYYAACLASRGDFETASKMATAALRLIGRAPTWYHVPHMMVDFAHGKYENVTGLINQNLDESSYSFYLMGLAAKCHIGEIDQVRSILADIIDKEPSYADKASAALQLWHLHPDLARPVYEGLLLAGLDINALKSSI